MRHCPQAGAAQPTLLEAPWKALLAHMPLPRKILWVLRAADLAVELVQLLLVVLHQVGQPRRLKVGLKVGPVALLQKKRRSS
jgi:hypothetical protein